VSRKSRKRTTKDVPNRSGHVLGPNQYYCGLVN
jgi:hypothetical protein